MRLNPYLNDLVRSMIFVELTLINLETSKLAGKYYKEFTNHDDFNKFYELNKSYGDVIMNVMKYNHFDKPSLKNVYDAKLLSLSRIREI